MGVNEMKVNKQTNKQGRIQNQILNNRNTINVNATWGKNQIKSKQNNKN